MKGGKGEVEDKAQKKEKDENVLLLREMGVRGEEKKGKLIFLPLLLSVTFQLPRVESFL